MEFGEKDVKKLIVFILLGILGISFFLVIKPILLPIIGGLILAYIFSPLYAFVKKYIKNKSLAAVFVSAIAILIILVPLWFLIPIIIQEVFEVFKLTQNLDLQGFISSLFPASSKAFNAQLVANSSSIISKVGSSVLNYLVDFLLNLPFLLINLFIV